MNKLPAPFTWARRSADNYEVSSRGDKRFSALFAKLSDGRSIEQAYQLDVKGFRRRGKDWRCGKGQPPLNGKSREQLWTEYLDLWRIFFKENPVLLDELFTLSSGKTITDMFASSEISQARACSILLNERLVTLQIRYFEGGD